MNRAAYPTSAAAPPERRAPRSRFRLAVPLYLALLLLTAAMGAVNRTLLSRQLRLMAEKEALLADVAVERGRAVAVNGPTAIALWATANGMVPVPEAGSARLIAPTAAPDLDPYIPTMELRTIWR